MKFAIVASVLAAGSAVSAAPTKRETNFGGIAGPLGGLLGGSMAAPIGGSVQNGVADIFKLADTILNIPSDAIRKMLQGNFGGAATGLVQSVVKAGTDVPKDAMGLVTPVTNAMQGKKQS